MSIENFSSPRYEAQMLDCGISKAGVWTYSLVGEHLSIFETLESQKMDIIDILPKKLVIRL